MVYVYDEYINKWSQSQKVSIKLETDIFNNIKYQHVPFLVIAARRST